MTRRAIPTTCHECRQDILIGDDADRAALAAIVDPIALNRSGELLAVVDGRQTFELDQGLLYRRDRWSIHGVPRGEVVSVHRCGQPPPYTWRQPTPARTHPKVVDF